MEKGRLRELRHDFRHEYGTRYEDVEVEEALDLIHTLPEGSLFISAMNPALSWPAWKHSLADVQDILLRGFYGANAPRVTRPADIVERRRAHEKAMRTRARIEQTEWVEVEEGG